MDTPRHITAFTVAFHYQSSHLVMKKNGDSSINEEEGEFGDVGPLMNVRASLGCLSSSGSLVAGSRLEVDAR
jgi:hypothetical protein